MRACLLMIVLGAAGLCSAAASAPPDAAIDIDNFAFSPTELAIPAGTTVVWTNRDDIPHTVVGAEATHAYKSGPLDTNDRFAHRFDTPGRFAFFCSLHAHMQGVIVVR